MGYIVDEMMAVLGLGAIPATFPDLIIFIMRFAVCSGILLFFFGSVKYWMASIFGAGKGLF